MLALSLLVVLSADPSPCQRELFRIERSKNANVVLYEATQDPDEPVSATWLMLAAQGDRQPLTFFEKLMAYGFDVRLNRARDGAVLKLKALQERALRLSQRGACLVAIAVIDGAEAVLQRVFVKTDEHGPVPTVLSVELFGVDVATGATRVERLVR